MDKNKEYIKYRVIILTVKKENNSCFFTIIQKIKHYKIEKKKTD